MGLAQARPNYGDKCATEGSRKFTLTIAAMSDNLSDRRPELKDILLALQDVTEWQDLGIYLGLPDATIRLIASHHDVMGHKRMMISEWLKYDTEASWEKLARVLTEMKKNVIAANIRKKYVPAATTEKQPGETSTLTSDTEEEIQLRKLTLAMVQNNKG